MVTRDRGLLSCEDLIFNRHDGCMSAVSADFRKIEKEMLRGGATTIPARLMNSSWKQAKDFA